MDAPFQREKLIKQFALNSQGNKITVATPEKNNRNNFHLCRINAFTFVRCFLLAYH